MLYGMHSHRDGGQGVGRRTVGVRDSFGLSMVSQQQLTQLVGVDRSMAERRSELVWGAVGVPRGLEWLNFEQRAFIGAPSKGCFAGCSHGGAFSGWYSL